MGVGGGGWGWGGDGGGGSPSVGGRRLLREFPHVRVPHASFKPAPHHLCHCEIPSTAGDQPGGTSCRRAHLVGPKH